MLPLLAASALPVKSGAKSIFTNKYVLVGIGVMILSFFLFRRKPEPKLDIKLDYEDTDLTDAEATIIANACYTAMDGLGTDENVLETMLLPLSEDSFKHVYQKFGIREDMDLVQWLVYELGEDDLKQFQDRFDVIP